MDGESQESFFFQRGGFNQGKGKKRRVCLRLRLGPTTAKNGSAAATVAVWPGWQMLPDQQLAWYILQRY